MYHINRVVNNWGHLVWGILELYYLYNNFVNLKRYILKLYNTYILKHFN